jgi:hypothetical protein
MFDVVYSSQMCEYLKASVSRVLTPEKEGSFINFKSLLTLTNFSCYLVKSFTPFEIMSNKSFILNINLWTKDYINLSPHLYFLTAA